jgi:hypothetical protein
MSKFSGCSSTSASSGAQFQDTFVSEFAKSFDLLCASAVMIENARWPKPLTFACVKFFDPFHKLITFCYMLIVQQI